MTDPRIRPPALSQVAGHQPELFADYPARTPEHLRRTLIQSSGQQVRLSLTQNRVAMVTIRWQPSRWDVRLDRAFLDAPAAVIEALAQYLRTRSGAAWSVVRRYAGTIRPAPVAPARVRVRPGGRVYDLEAIRERVNRQYFNGAVRCRITWGRLGVRRRRARCRSIRFGSYIQAQNLVRVNPLLDDPRVPAEFLEYIVFHEMLHAVAPSEAGAVRRHHHATFRTLEKSFPDLARLRRLSAELVDRLAR